MTRALASCRLIGVVPAGATPTSARDFPITWLENRKVRGACVPDATPPQAIAAWQHDHFRAVPLVPLRGDQVLSTDQAQAWLEQQADVLAWFLDDVAGRAEWHVTAHRNPDLPPVDLPPDAEAASLADWVWRRLRAGTDDACPLPIAAPLAAAGQFAHGALLVPAASEPDWLAAIQQLQEDLSAAQVALSVKGPMPAYHFTPFADPATAKSATPTV